MLVVSCWGSAVFVSRLCRRRDHGAGAFAERRPFAEVTAFACQIRMGAISSRPKLCEDRSWHAHGTHGLRVAAFAIILISIARVC